ncbi:2-polyprenyl-3-methyl-5-hydroxy-6-metoxy-1,4-benzoquinol methylase [Paraburkholderia atlantica]|uniref:class I SAM-dependent methyltransferase n=1 Tax=Paraburkholderia atlantica TaxID=2654982 RepID=UPI00128E6106|nr:methyltransferase domain-containing protein [Paraburkholderia atlantica]MPW04333.1 methyltransferase domain-containing protein [Paraburkholderia atlantica]
MAIFDQGELKEIDEILASIENGATRDVNLQDRLARISIRAAGELRTLNEMDPFSDEYLTKIRQVHEEIVGQMHTMEPQATRQSNHEGESSGPYPWDARHPKSVAAMLIACGFLIQVADIPRHGRILEVGCGTGSLTWNLARMGYRVDALDPSFAQCDSVVATTRDLPFVPNVIASTLNDWIDKRQKSYKYDAVIFFESFHRIMDHKSCLEKLTRDGHIEDNAKIIIAAESIFPSTSELLPYPWGPRLDGASLRSMRKWGRLELGFTRRYLQHLLARVGMQYKHFEAESALPLSRIVVGSRRIRRPYYEVLLTAQSRRHEATLEEGFDLTVEGFPMFLKWASGLSITEGGGRWTVGPRVDLVFNEQLPSRVEIVLELNDVFGPNVGKHLTVTVDQKSQAEILRTVEDRKTYSFKFRDIKTKIMTLQIPHPTRPKDIPELCNEDARQIGIAIRSISFREL